MMAVRIASLIPSGTDIAAALGLEKYIVGKSHTCDLPAVSHLPILTQSRVRYDLSPREIDDAVTNAIQNGEGNASLYVTDKALLNLLKPDIVLTQTICDVCAVNANSAARDLPPGAQLVNLCATGFAGLWDDLREVARVAGPYRAETPAYAETLIEGLQRRLAKVHQTVRDRPRPKVLVLEWSDPPFIGGHWVPEIIARAGGRHLLGSASLPSRRAGWEEIADADPDTILLAPCGYGLEETMQQGRALLEYPDFRKLRAVQSQNVWATNATHLFSRCTPQSVRAVEVAAGILHPESGLEFRSDEAMRME